HTWTTSAVSRLGTPYSICNSDSSIGSTGLRPFDLLKHIRWTKFAIASEGSAVSQLIRSTVLLGTAADTIGCSSRWPGAELRISPIAVTTTILTGKRANSSRATLSAHPQT